MGIGDHTGITFSDRLHFVKVIGIDPGFSGALAMTCGSVVVLAEKTPCLKVAKSSGKGTRQELNLPAMARILRDCLNYEPRQRDDFTTPVRTVAVVELAQAMPKQGVSSSSRFVGTFFAWVAMLVCLDIPHVIVPPQTWKKVMGLTRDKDYSRQIAMRIFPAFADQIQHKNDDGLAEAALMARYGFILAGNGKL